MACPNSFIRSERTRHAHYHSNDHLVWCAKFRRPVLAGEVGKRLTELIPLEVERLGGRVLELVVQPDQVHLFASFSPTLAIAQMMFRLKGATAHQLRKAFPHLKSRPPSLWPRHGLCCQFESQSQIRGAHVFVMDQFLTWTL